MRLEVGKRYVLIGKTGSGKTYFLKHFIMTSVIFPVLIVDTKADPNFDELLYYNGVVVSENSIDAIEKIQVFPVVIYRPEPSELKNISKIDEVLLFIYNYVKGCVVAVDEAYALHEGGVNIPQGYFSLITRGGTKKISVISGMQRPKMISRFLLTEANSFFIFKLSDIEDRQRVYEIIAIDDIIDNIPERYHFYYFNTDNEDFRYCLPVEIDESLREKFEDNLYNYLDRRPILL